MNLVAWQTTVQNQWGAIVPSPIITVRDFEGNLATIYTSEGVVKDNPFVGNTEGFCQFWAKVGHYSIQGSFGAGVTPVWEVELSDYTNATISREEAVIRIANGEWDEVDDGVETLFGANHYRKSSGATTISDMLNWVPVTPLVISQFASATTLSTNAQPAVRAALLYARTLVQDIPQSPSRPGFAGHISVDLEGKLLKVSNTVSMDQCAGVELINGALSADASTFPAPSGGVYPYVLKFGGANNSGSRYMNVRNLTIECNKVANGVDCVNLQNGMGEDINIHGQVQYGFRKYGPRNGACRFRNIRASEFWAGESGVELRANRTSIGISDEAADEIWENCEGIYCLTNIYIKGFGAHRHIGGHPFHGQVTDIPTFIITDAVSDGSGGTRCTTSSTTGVTNGDMCVMPYINGITTVNNVGGRPGVYPVSNVTSTTFDVAGYTFTGVFADSNSPKASRWADEMVNVLIDADVDTVDLDLEIDNGKVQVLQTATNSPDVRMRLYGVGQNVASARVALELVSDGKTNADFGGVAAEIHTSQNGFRFVAINGGTVDIVPRCAINEFRSKKANRSTELLAVGSGSSTKPSVYFTSVDDGDALSITPNTGFFGKSDHTPALTVGGVEKLHFHASMLLPKNGYAIANTMTLAEFFAANAELASLPDGTVIHIGPLGFIKNAASSKIASAPGWDAMSPVRPEHFADNTVPGTTDMAPAIRAAIAGYRECHFGLTSATTNYFCASALGDVIDSKLVGANRDKTIIVFGAAIDPATPAIRLGRRSKITGLTLGYELAALTGTEVENERILVDLGPSGGSLVKAAYGLDDVRLRRCGTGLTSKDNEAFNYSVTNIFIQTFTYKAWVLPVSTGQTIDNIYIENGPYYECQGAIEMQYLADQKSSGSVSSIGQINIHQCQTHGPLIMADGLDGVTLRAVHCEANLFLDADGAAFDFAGANVTFDNLEFIHSGWLAADQRMFMLRQGGQNTDVTGYTVKTSRLRINNLWIQGLNQLNEAAYTLPTSAGFPNPSSITNPLAGAPTGFKFFGREVGAAGRYIVEINNFSMHQYADSTYSKDKGFIRAIRANSDEGVTFTSAASVENFCANGKIKGWLKTSSAANNDEMAPGWIIKYSSGTLRGTREMATWQGKSIALLRADNTGTTGDYHYVDYVIKDPYRFIGATDMTLSFLAKVGVAAQTINRINLIRDDGAGGTVTETMTLGSQPELAFDTGLRRHQINFVNPLTAFSPAGLTPTVTIRFAINTTTPVTCDLYLGQLALEIGEQQTQSEV